MYTLPGGDFHSVHYYVVVLFLFFFLTNEMIGPVFDSQQRRISGKVVQLTAHLNV